VDSFTDLAIGSPWQRVKVGDTIVAEGSVEILYGSTKGLSIVGKQFWSPMTPGITEINTMSEFGTSIVAGNFGKDTSSGCYDDLGIGAPRDNHVHVLYGSANGLSTSGSDSCVFCQKP